MLNLIVIALLAPLVLLLVWFAWEVIRLQRMRRLRATRVGDLVRDFLGPAGLLFTKSLPIDEKKTLRRLVVLACAFCLYVSVLVLVVDT